MDVLGLYKWEIWQGSGLILGEGIGDNYNENVLRTHYPGTPQLSLQPPRPLLSTGRRSRAQCQGYACSPRELGNYPNLLATLLPRSVTN